MEHAVSSGNDARCIWEVPVLMAKIHTERKIKTVNYSNKNVKTKLVTK
jgi:hypothetical protein